MNFKMEMPAEIQITYTLEQGYTYYFEEESFSSEEPHYFVILNKEPQNDKFIYLVNATSQVKRAKAIQATLGHPSETYIEVTPTDCDFLTKDSIFNCNSIIKKSKQALIDKVKAGKLTLKGSMPNDILKNLIKGATASPLVENKIKKLLC